MRNKKFRIGKFEHFSRVDRVTSSRVTFCGKEFTVEAPTQVFSCEFCEISKNIFSC